MENDKFEIGIKPPFFPKEDLPGMSIQLYLAKSTKSRMEQFSVTIINNITGDQITDPLRDYYNPETQKRIEVELKCSLSFPNGSMAKLLAIIEEKKMNHEYERLEGKTLDELLTSVPYQDDSENSYQKLVNQLRSDPTVTTLKARDFDMNYHCGMWINRGAYYKKYGRHVFAIPCQLIREFTEVYAPQKLKALYQKWELKGYIIDSDMGFRPGSIKGGGRPRFILFLFGDINFNPYTEVTK